MFNSQYVGQSLPSINLENMNYSDHKMIINSPRSLNVCRQNNVDMTDLYYYDFHEFRMKHPELTSLNIDIQQSHYFHEQAARELLLTKLIRERRELINNENELYLKQKEEKKEKKKKQKELEKKKNKSKPLSEVEKTREKKKRELFNELESRLREAYKKKENELKTKLEENKKNDLLLEEKIRRKEEEEHKKFLEKERIKKEKLMQEKQERTRYEYEIKEKIRKEKEKEKEKYNIMKKKEREKERKKKAENFERNLKNLENQKQLAHDEKERREKEKQDKKKLFDKYINDKRSQDLYMKKKEHEERMNINIEKNNMKREENIQRMRQKEENILNNLIQNQQQKDEMFLKKKKEEELINKHHQENLDWNEYQKDKSNQAFFEKQAKIEQFRIRNEMEKKRYIAELQNYNRDKEQKVLEQKEYYKNMKIDDALRRIEEKNMEFDKNMEMRKRENELNRRKKEEEEEQKKERMVYERSRIENNYIDNLMKDMEEKEKRYEENRKKMQEKEKAKYDFIKKQNEEKEKIKKHFEELTTKNKGEIDIEKIKKLFPDDEELHKKLDLTKQEFEKKQSKQIDAYERDKFQRRETLKKLKRSKSSEKSKTIKSNTNNNINNINNENTNQNNISKNININTNNNRKRPKTANKVKRINSVSSTFTIEDIPKISGKEMLNENKIKFMVKDYKERLMKDFLKFFNKEKEAENERKKMIKEANTEKERKRLEKIFAMQRGQSADKIGEYNKIIDEKLEKYEKELTKLYEKQKYNIKI